MDPNASAGWLPLTDALDRLLEAAFPVEGTESVELEFALGRVTAEPITAPVSVPPWDNSAMDGYAVKAQDCAMQQPLLVTGTLTAGMNPSAFKVTTNEAIRIMTGAPLPAGADAVVMQENTARKGDNITLLKSVEKNENVRPCGNDIIKGSVVVPQGTRIEASHIMLLASLGLTHVNVIRKVKVGIIATGDELVAPGGCLENGQIFESNRTGIRSLLAPLNVAITDYGIVKDDPDALAHVFTKAAEQEDVIISSGGVSVGDADFVKTVVGELGSIDFWKIAIKPGKPFAFGALGKSLFCGVPGNPVSAFVTTQKLVLPLVKKLQGEQNVGSQSPLTISATLQHDIHRRPGREDFQRAMMFYDNNHQLCVTPLPKQSSGVMTTLTQANCFLVLPADCAKVSAGEKVAVQPFSVTDNWTQR